MKQSEILQLGQQIKDLETLKKHEPQLVDAIKKHAFASTLMLVNMKKELWKADKYAAHLFRMSLESYMEGIRSVEKTKALERAVQRILKMNKWV